MRHIRRENLLRPAVGALALVFMMTATSASSASAAAVAAANWPQWRGPQRDGRVKGPAWPASLSGEHLVRLWHVELGPGYPGPIIGPDRVFVAETRDRKDEVVRALDRNTGREIWRAEWPGAMSVVFIAKRNGDWIRSTPAYDGQSLYVAGMRDVLVCLNADSGKERWRVDFVEEFKTPLPPFGFVCSPLLDGDHVYVQAGGGFCKLDKHTGKVQWRVFENQGLLDSGAFSSPFLTTLCGVRQILVQGRQTLAGIDPESGKVLWTQGIPASMGMNILTPVVQGDRIFTSAYGAGSYVFEIRREDDEYDVKTIWKNGIQGYMSTPVVIDGHVYMHLRNRRFTCLSLADGTARWTSQPYGQYWSLVTQNDLILALDQRGLLLLIRATPEKYDLIDSRTISQEETWAHLAVSGDQIFVRELDGITAYRWK